MRKATFLIELTEQHRRIWHHLIHDHSLARILDLDIDVVETPASPSEKMLVKFVILHVHTTLEAIRTGLIAKSENLEADIGEFFSLPIPNSIWNEVGSYQNKRTQKRIEAAIQSHNQ